VFYRRVFWVLSQVTIASSSGEVNSCRFVGAPMRLLRLQDAEIGPRDRVFRHSRMRALIGWIAGFAATAAFFFNAYTRKWPPGYFFGSFLLLFVK
jgi:hypothetical protein